MINLCLRLVQYSQVKNLEIRLQLYGIRKKQYDDQDNFGEKY